MGLILDCFRGSNTQQNRNQSNNNTTPDTETRRLAAAEAATRRLQQSENRGVDEDKLRQMKKRQAERERIEEQHAILNKKNDDGPVLRWQAN